MIKTYFCIGKRDTHDVIIYRIDNNQYTDDVFQSKLYDNKNKALSVMFDINTKRKGIDPVKLYTVDVTIQEMEIIIKEKKEITSKRATNRFCGTGVIA